jgi:gamma-glutamylcyclotransferase (GGCT)/AIG2-like uncharacterized protein YtfP
MQHLFTYGTLMCEEIMEEVSGCRFQKTGAVLEGYCRRGIRGEEYPGIVPKKDESVCGVVYRGIPDEAWARLDRFEGALYERHAVTVRLAGEKPLVAWTYIVHPRYRYILTEHEWDFSLFLREGKARFRSGYGGYSHI